MPWLEDIRTKILFETELKGKQKFTSINRAMVRRHQQIPSQILSRWNDRL